MKRWVLITEFNIKAYPEEKQIYTILVNGKAVLKPHQQGILRSDNTEFEVKTLSSLSEVL